MFLIVLYFFICACKVVISLNKRYLLLRESLGSLRLSKEGKNFQSVVLAVYVEVVVVISTPLNANGKWNCTFSSPHDPQLRFRSHFGFSLGLNGP